MKFLNSALAGAAGLALCLGFSGHAMAGKISGKDLSPYMPSMSDGEVDGEKPSISIRSSKGSRVEEGETVRFKINANRDGFAHVYVISASGRIQLWMENVPIKAGRTLTYPTNPDMRILATAPAGKDRIVAVLTRQRVDGFSGRQTTSDPSDIDLDEATFRSEMEAMMESLPRSQWTWSRAVVHISQ